MEKAPERHGLTCKRCGHSWFSHNPQPNRCARCKAKYWWRPARIPKEQQQLGSVGRPSAFPQLDTLEVGKSLVIPWNRDKIDGVDYYTNKNVQAHARRFGRIYHTFPDSARAGLVVVRKL